MKLLFSLLCFFSVALPACERRAAPSSGSQSSPSPANEQSGDAKFEVCGLIKNEEIQAIQGSPIKETKASGHSNRGFHSAQCFYAAAEFSRSVSLSVTRSDPPGTNSVRDLWKETFARSEEHKEERKGDAEKKESLREQSREKGEGEGAPPKKIDGIGEEAYWAGNRVGGALYVLKKDAFLRISLGGPDTEEAKINKSKELAAKALERL
jgi:hypothetical protein